jgi:hypothetical protein
MTSDNVLSADNQQERLRLPHPWYVVGLVDGEGSFHIALYKDERMKTHIKVIPEFHVSQNDSSRVVLEELQSFFQCGNMKINHRGSVSDHTHVFVVRNREDLLKRIIPFFEKYALRTLKANDFKTFARIVRMVDAGMHQTPKGVKQIIELAYSMNNRGKRRTTQQIDLIKIVESSETIREILRKT